MTSIFVAANGGHLSQLVELEKRMAGNRNERIWVTFDSPQSRSLLAGRQMRFVRSIEERDIVGVCRGFFDARNIFSRQSVNAVISTGSAIALPFLLYASMRGIPAHYIESAARVGSPSLTGKVLEWTPGIKLYRQYPKAIRGRWQYGGSVFDGFTAGKGIKTDVRRIVVTLGSGTHTFRRLVERLVSILPSDADVLWQTGSTPVADLAINAHPLVPAAVLDKAIANADVVIGHAGCGTALSALNAGKFPILVPREPQFGELVDTHQIEIARWLGERNLALHRDPNSLAVDDLFAVAGRRVDRENNPPAFRLA
jgi:UDP-N-acetylglucosamine--N-acetylmuramyl-(pentapeptide) pyrophosphoryl-undecaprenol N-acetylglucosamine transferase